MKKAFSIILRDGGIITCRGDDLADAVRRAPSELEPGEQMAGVFDAEWLKGKALERLRGESEVRQ